MRLVPAFVIDAVLVIIFAVLGRASHNEEPWMFWLTAWPFLVALVLAYAVALLLVRGRKQPWTLTWGAVTWFVTVVGGMLVRIASGDTAQLPFVLVATATLALFLVGWRLIVFGIRASRRRQAAQRGD
ncbi:DUF3054 domain-containing protein [Microbacterium sp. YY-01]|uniref:DUF3054 domain-containing protein n=1 Tax=Microbacterium sp. YY-01 TaxID=3421634 RepID=UPI003D18118F